MQRTRAGDPTSRAHTKYRQTMITAWANGTWNGNIVGPHDARNRSGRQTWDARQVAYRETIRKRSPGRRQYIKQTGGAASEAIAKSTSCRLHSRRRNDQKIHRRAGRPGQEGVGRRGRQMAICLIKTHRMLSLIKRWAASIPGIIARSMRGNSRSHGKTASAWSEMVESRCCD